MCLERFLEQTVSSALQLLKTGRRGRVEGRGSGEGGGEVEAVREEREGKVAGSSGHTPLIASENLARWRSCLYLSRFLPVLGAEFVPG